MNKIIITIDDNGIVGVETDKDLKHYEIIGYIEMAKNGIEYQAMTKE